jgi:hypothetical protein
MRFRDGKTEKPRIKPLWEPGSAILVGELMLIA